MRSIIIDAKNREIREVNSDDNDSLKFLQSVVGGYIERGHTLKNGDDVFVNEEGMLMELSYGFSITGGHQPFFGNGVIVSHDDLGETTDAKSLVEDIKKQVTFLKF